MKSFLLTLALLIISLISSIPAQEQDLLLQLLASENQDTLPGLRKNKKINHKLNNEDFYHQHKFINDCSSLTREDYKLPPEYLSNFVQITEWQSYRGTRNGIIMTDNNTPIRITTENSKIPENNITALALVDGNQLWIGTYSSGIVVGTGKDVKPFKIQAIQSHDLYVVSISVDATGLVWAVYQNGGIECFLNGISCRYFPKD